jgi:phosphoglucomutase
MENFELKAQAWLGKEFDDVTRKEVQRLINDDKKELEECFYQDLEFGTGGLRGIMGVGTNRMNVYTVSMATQGLCNYLKKCYADGTKIKVAIAYDSRINSPLFASKAAEVFASNNLLVYLFSSLRPTPELSFAIRHLGCQSGIVMTASHNPKEYNGYKAYWNDGAQIVAPHDKNIIDEVRKITSLTQVKTIFDKANIIGIDRDIDAEYRQRIMGLILSPETIKLQKDLKIVYTSLHGTGITHVPDLLREVGFENVTLVDSQSIPDGNFPTVESPNPEEAKALALAIEKAEEIKADIVLGTDPDADRVGIAVRDLSGKMVLLNGNQAATVLVYYLLTKWKEKHKLTGKEFVCKTIVTTELITEICKSFNVKLYNTLTGFKYISEVIRNLEGKEKFIGGGEESYGYLIDDFVRDKDAIMSSVILCEVAAWAKDKGSSFYNELLSIYQQFGYFKESLLSLTKKGKNGVAEIAEMMNALRNNPPKNLVGHQVTKMADYENKIMYNFTNNTSTPIELPKSNVLQFFLEDGSNFTARPSGTEPKIKFYFGLKEPLKNASAFNEASERLNNKAIGIQKELNLI